MKLLSNVVYLDPMLRADGVIGEWTWWSVWSKLCYQIVSVDSVRMWLINTFWFDGGR